MGAFHTKHYKLLSQLIRELEIEDGAKEAIAYLFESFFVEDNPRFSINIWRRETGVDGRSET